MRRFTADGDGRRLRRPAAPVAGVYLRGTALDDGVRHGGHGCRPSRPPPPPRSDRSGPLPPASTATATTERPPPSTLRGGDPQVAGHPGLAVAAAHGGPHCPPPPGRWPTAPMTLSTTPARTRTPLPPHDARRRLTGAGRQGPGGGGLAVGAACRSPNRPAARGERARPTPRLPTNRRHARHFTQYSPAPHHTSPGTARTPTTAPDTPSHPTTPVPAPNNPPPPPPRPARRRPDPTPATTPHTRPHPTTPAPAPPARVPPHPKLPRPPPRQPPHPTLPHTPPRQAPHLPHARHRALRTRSAPHPGTHHL